jgi:hypothetical protein
MMGSSKFLRNTEKDEYRRLKTVSTVVYSSMRLGYDKKKLTIRATAE